MTDAPDPIWPTIDPKAARLYGLLAARARKVVILRRGPRRLTRVLIWTLAGDTIEGGQWFRGRIQERRCDVSPDGKLLACAVVKGRPPHYSWTALSRPPHLTALAFWPMVGGYGGGLFGHDWRTFRLNQDGSDGLIVPKGSPHMPEDLTVLTAPAVNEAALLRARLERDGWDLDEERKPVGHKRGSPLGRSFDPPRVRSKPIRRGWRLVVEDLGGVERNGRAHVETARIEDREGRTILNLGRIDWVEVDPIGDVLVAADGRLYRIHDAEVRLVADPNAMDFETVVAPREALEWPR
ncbi:hypothetical protein [Caulobacter hibisci]|uniref:Uncharacterized protein n=1 Tax=Caulobacter hibisci TaxID=2035993 RepID=A0ABS0T2C2_9CAUL|nr:hypothetical protein [Caulobacter hibisci]MBI1685881.1 hypothetical protein [Caulobacter hibisci]